MNRSCAIGHGEFGKNLLLMREHSGVEWFQTWADRALRTLRAMQLLTSRPMASRQRGIQPA